jgi:hypothetical protein
MADADVNCIWVGARLSDSGYAGAHLAMHMMRQGSRWTCGPEQAAQNEKKLLFLERCQPDVAFSRLAPCV